MRTLQRKPVRAKAFPTLSSPPAARRAAASGSPAPSPAQAAAGPGEPSSRRRRPAAHLAPASRLSPGTAAARPPASASPLLRRVPHLRDGTAPAGRAGASALTTAEARAPPSAPGLTDSTELLAGRRRRLAPLSRLHKARSAACPRRGGSPGGWLLGKAAAQRRKPRPGTAERGPSLRVGRWVAPGQAGSPPPRRAVPSVLVAVRPQKVSCRRWSLGLGPTLRRRAGLGVQALLPSQRPRPACCQHSHTLWPQERS